MGTAVFRVKIQDILYYFCLKQLRINHQYGSWPKSVDLFVQDFRRKTIHGKLAAHSSLGQEVGLAGVAHGLPTPLSPQLRLCLPVTMTVLNHLVANSLALQSLKP